jgi:hypothetical protein
MFNLKCSIPLLNVLSLDITRQSDPRPILGWTVLQAETKPPFTGQFQIAAQPRAKECLRVLFCSRIRPGICQGGVRIGKAVRCKSIFCIWFSGFWCPMAFYLNSVLVKINTICIQGMHPIVLVIA